MLISCLIIDSNGNVIVTVREIEQLHQYITIGTRIFASMSHLMIICSTFISDSNQIISVKSLLSLLTC